MASITITFDNPLNVSCQVGDFAYAVATTSSGGFTVNGSNNLSLIGQIREINNPTTTPTIICHTLMDSSAATAQVPQGAFILFAKDERANMSTILGYYAEVKLVCDDELNAELFSVGMGTFDSSK